MERFKIPRDMLKWIGYHRGIFAAELSSLPLGHVSHTALHPQKQYDRCIVQSALLHRFIGRIVLLSRCTELVSSFLSQVYWISPWEIPLDRDHHLMLSPIDLAIVLLTLLLPLAWYFRDSLPIISGKLRPATVSDGNGVHVKVDDGDPRDFVEKMENGVSGPISIDSGHRCKLS